MALARLTKQCHECPFVETCEHKEMEALGYLPEPIMADVKVPVTADIAAPILRETVSRVVDGKVVTMYKDELEKILYKDLYSHLGLQIGGYILIEMPYPYIIEMICDWWAFSWIKGDLSEMFAWYKDHADYIKLHNNTRSIVEEILEMIRTKLTEVENAEN